MEEKTISFSEFIEFYKVGIREPSCLPECLEDICGGCMK
jgi:hypothetical protein